MDYSDFLYELEGRLQQELGDKYLVRVESNRGDNKLVVLEKPEMQGFTINAERAFRDFRNGISLNTLMIGLVDTVRDTLRDMPKVDMSVLDDYDRLLNKVVVKMVPRHGNEVALQNMPHIDVLDMAAVFRVVFSGKDELTSAAITNQMLKKFNVPSEKFSQEAVKAAEINNPAKIEGLGNILSKLEGEDENSYESPLIFAGTKEKLWGAGVIVYPAFMEEAAQKIGGDFILLPSSIHEVLLLPDDGTVDASYMKNMVTSINMSQVVPEDRLTNNVYHYDAKARIFDTIDHYQEVQRKHSVLKDLDDSRKIAVKENGMAVPASRTAHQDLFL